MAQDEEPPQDDVEATVAADATATEKPAEPAPVRRVQACGENVMLTGFATGWRIRMGHRRGDLHDGRHATSHLLRVRNLTDPTSLTPAAVTWGANSTFGVFLSFYRANNYFAGATDIQYAFVGGLSISIAMFIAPLTNFLVKLFGFRTPMLIGTGFTVLGQVFAGLSNRIWQLFITQGLMFGAGIGMVRCGLLIPRHQRDTELVVASPTDLCGFKPHCRSVVQ